jgi:sugar phosphate isomerase/epimerase
MVGEKGLTARKLSISNIAWSREPFEPYLELIRGEGVAGVEVAASVFWQEPVDASPAQRQEFRGMIEAHGLQVTGLHSLLFSRPELQLLADGRGGEEVRDYLKRLADLCADLGGSYLVFGGSKNRLRGAMPIGDADRRAIDVLRDVGEHAIARGCFFTLEALPPPVCDFLTNLDECAALCEAVQSPGIQYQFDSGAAEKTERETSDARLAEHLRRVRHFQINDFELLAPGSKNPEPHKRWSRVADAAKYSGWMSIEMRKPTELPVADGIRNAIRFVRRQYMENS